MAIFDVCAGLTGEELRQCLAEKTGTGMAREAAGTVSLQQQYMDALARDDFDAAEKIKAKMAMAASEGYNRKRGK